MPATVGAGRAGSWIFGLGAATGEGSAFLAGAPGGFFVGFGMGFGGGGGGGLGAGSSNVFKRSTTD